MQRRAVVEKIETPSERGNKTMMIGLWIRMFESVYCRVEVSLVVSVGVTSGTAQL